MTDRSKKERDELRARRAASGRFPAQVSGLTRELSNRLLAVRRDRLRGFDEMVCELVTAELARIADGAA